LDPDKKAYLCKTQGPIIANNIVAHANGVNTLTEYVPSTGEIILIPTVSFIIWQLSTVLIFAKKGRYGGLSSLPGGWILGDIFTAIAKSYHLFTWQTWMQLKYPKAPVPVAVMAMNSKEDVSC
jgi:hypothetical protein